MQIHLTVAMMQPSVANTSHSCNFPPTFYRPSIFHPKDLPPRGRGDRPQAVEGVRTRCFYAEYLFSSDTHRTHEAYEAYEAQEPIFGKTVFCGRNSGIATVRCVCNCWLCCCCLENGESSSADDGTRSARPRGLGGNFDFSPLNPLGTP